MQYSIYLKITLLLISSLTIMAAATVVATLPEIALIFKDIPHIELLSKLIVTLPSLFMAIFAPIIGININKFGRKRLLIVGLILYGIGGTSGFFLNDIYWILLTRAILGISVAILLSVLGTLIGDYFETQERHSYMGLQIAFMNIGGIIFITLGGFLAEISWRVPFLIYLAPFLILPLVIKYIYEPKFHHEVLNIDFSLSQVYHIFLYYFIGVAVFYMMPTQIPFILYYNFGVEGSEAGIIVAMYMVASTIISLFYKHIKQKISYHKAYAIVTLSFGIGFILISYTSHLWLLLLGLIIAGIGTGILMVNNMNHLLHIVPPKARGKVVGIHSSVMSFAMFLSPIIVAPFTYFFTLKESFGIIGGIILVSSLWFLLLKRED